jgi:hypothetical protein
MIQKSSTLNQPSFVSLVLIPDKTLELRRLQHRKAAA